MVVSYPPPQPPQPRLAPAPPPAPSVLGEDSDARPEIEAVDGALDGRIDNAQSGADGSAPHAAAGGAFAQSPPAAAPSITAVVPVFNQRALLPRAVASLRRDAAIARVIVVDDGSTDGSVEALDATNDRMIVLRQENAGPAAARNRGVEEALRRSTQGAVLFLDADDEFEPGAGTAMLAGLQSHPTAAVVVGARHERTASETGLGRLVAPPEAWANRPLANRADILRPQPFFGASGMLVARRVFEMGIRFDEAMRVGEDRDFAYRAAGRGPALVIDRPVLRVTIHEGGANLTGPDHVERWVADHLRLVRRHGRDPGASGPLREQTNWILGHASRVLAKRGRRLEREVWREMLAVYRERGWGRPWRAMKWRYMLSYLRPKR